MPPSADTDAKAKSSVRASSRAARPGAVSVPVPKPGAVSVPMGEASRLDERIARKQRKAAPAPSPVVAGAVPATERPADSAKAAAAAGGRPVGRPAPTNGQVVRRFHSGLGPAESIVPARTASGTLDYDVRAKQQGKPASGVVSKPGSFRTASPAIASADGRVELSQMERDAAAKNAARRTAASAAPGARSANSASDAVVQRKIRAVGGGSPTAGDNIARKTQREQSRAQVSSLDDRIASKVRAADVGRAASRRPTSLIGGDIELSDVAAKRMAVDPLASASPEGRAMQSNQMESDALSKKAAAAAVRSAAMAPGGFVSQGDVFAESKKMGGGVAQSVSKSEKAPTSKMSEAGIQGFADMEFGTNYEVDQERGLAIAVAVEEEEEDIPFAVEYDPDAKPPLHQNRRFRLYAFLAFFALMAAAGGAVVGVVLTRDTETVDNTPYREKLGIRERIEKLVGQEELENPESPYAKATEWIIYEDPMEVEPEEVNFIQRYTMAYLYYATTIDGPWRSCNPPVGNEQASCSHSKLVAVFPNSYEEVPATRWLSSAHECEFAGVVCDDKLQVRDFEMEGQEMSGKFPGGVVNLPFLQSISFPWNGLFGPLPKEIVGMKHLINVEMQFNAFTGQIPAEWWQARNLVRINLGNNNITGSIPPEVQYLKNIKGLFLNDNKLTGSIPKEIGDLESLAYLRLSTNSIGGSIPTEFGNLKRLEELWLQTNVLTGSLAPELGDMEYMADFRVQSNSQLGGNIRDSFYNMTKLMRVDLFECNFTGTISPLIGNLKQLNSLTVSGNAALGGQVPVELAQLSLGALEIQGTNITGKIPDGICAMRGPQNLTDLIADCAVDPATGVAGYQCDCCSECCDAEGVCTPTTDSTNE